MNFFKSVFADEPDSESEALASESKDEGSNQDDLESDSDPESKSPSDAGKSNPSSESASAARSGWDFEGLIKTLATKSESVIDTYKRDLKEFSTGLKAETAVFREVANRAVKELPKAGVSTFDDLKTTVLKGTTQIISQGKEALLSPDQEISSPGARIGETRSLNYNRIDARLRAIQIDKETYCLEPEDLDEYKKWKSGFVLEEQGEELGKLFEENAAMENIYHKIVPSEIDPETFWVRYFYKVHKLKQAEEARASFLKKAIDEEELSWDVDEEEEDSDDGDGEDGKRGGESSKVGEATVSENEKKLVKSESEKENVVADVKKGLGSDGEFSKEAVKVDSVVKESRDGGKVGENVEETNVMNEKEKEKVENTVAKEENKPAAPAPVQLEKEVKGKSDESALKVEVGTTTDEDLEWNEIQDEGSDNEKPVSLRKSGDKAELQKRLSSAFEDEDLSWDIEDDDDDDD